MEGFEPVFWRGAGPQNDAIFEGFSDSYGRTLSIVLVV